VETNKQILKQNVYIKEPRKQCIELNEGAISCSCWRFYTR